MLCNVVICAGIDIEIQRICMKLFVWLIVSSETSYARVYSRAEFDNHLRSHVSIQK